MYFTFLIAWQFPFIYMMWPKKLRYVDGKPRKVTQVTDPRDKTRVLSINHVGSLETSTVSLNSPTNDMVLMSSSEEPPDDGQGRINDPAHSPMYASTIDFDIKGQMRELMMDKNNVNDIKMSGSVQR
jgi:hypothetical protein